ncbi:MAG TPA: endonuclease domain-containing protein [Gemmatimonadales bacterium]|nr:endonuclease domain-containing protein [Gemmatimonadales bacterium]
MSRSKTAIARRLRARGTEAEQRAWLILRNRRCLGLKIRRQVVIGGFVVDFYCSELRLVIELDGGIHADPEQRRYDRARDAVLRRLGEMVIRIPNERVSRRVLEGAILEVRGKR